MRFIVKKFLSQAAYSQTFFRIVERAYIFITRVRFQQIDRSELLNLKGLISTSIQPEKLGLIRLGSAHDGGYVMLRPETKDAEVISLGIADNLDFELALIDGSYARAIHCFDGSIKQLPEVRDGINFKSKYVKSVSTDNSLLLNEILADIEAKELILKVDIEGDEWGVFESLEVSELCKFSQIIGEFHGLASCTTNEKAQRMNEILDKLHQYFYLFNSHPNNWSEYRILKGVPIVDVLELSFVNKNHPSVTGSKIKTPFSILSPDILNSPCNPLGFEYIGT